jgi:deoxycytidine triphosphate deaminase
MSVLGIDEVLRRVREEGLITDLSKRELENPEGVGVDLRLGQVHVITEGGAFIEADGEAGLGKRKGVQTKLLAEWAAKGDVQEFVSIEPGKYYMVRTIEGLRTPLDLMPMVYPRGTLFRVGLQLLASKTDPGYEGPLAFGLKNLSDFPVQLQLGARIANIVFYRIEGRGTAYRGQHQGGRVAIHEEEQQV